MSARCVNLGCAQEVKDGWSFCSLCGTDNRPPAARKEISGCVHQIERGEFCVLCGASIIEENEPPKPGALWAEWIGWILLIGGVVMLGVSELMVRDLTSGPEGYRALHVPRRGLDLSKPATQVYLLARTSFVMIPAGIACILLLGRRWRIFKSR
jgi:hypothetical protein